MYGKKKMNDEWIKNNECECELKNVFCAKNTPKRVKKVRASRRKC